MKLYHGSKNIIEHPIYGYGKNIMIMVLDFIVQKILRWQKSGQFH